MTLDEKYQLINKKNNYQSSNLKNDILELKGVKDANKYLNLNEKNTYDFNLLDNIKMAINCLIKHMENHSDIYIQVDNDVDGITSAAMLYSYLTRSCNNKIFYNMQKGKGHGLDLNSIPKSVKLVIVPDASSNEIDKHKFLKNKNIDIIILDHHICDEISEYGIVVNNQLSKDYPNKDFSAAGVVYKFLQALDEELWQVYADDYLDLVALGNISDMMDIKSYETKYYISNGIRNIKNKMFKELIYKQSYSMNGEININNIAFYISPCVNALIRCGTYEDKIMLFEAFANIDTGRKFYYKSRKKETKGETIEENIYEHMSRLCVNAKSKQNRTKDKFKKMIIPYIKQNELYKNKIIICSNTDKLEKSMTGLMAMDIASIYNRPCLMLRKSDTDGCYRGSGRNIDSCDFPNLKEFLESTNLVKEVQGHNNAHGVTILEKNIAELIEVANDKLKDINFKKGVDYKVPFEELTDDFILTINDMRELWGTGLKEPLIYISDVYVNKEDIKLIGKNNNTICFVTEDIKFIKFFENEDTYNSIVNTNKNIVNFNIIGKCSVNTYGGKESLQIIIKDYEIK